MNPLLALLVLGPSIALADPPKADPPPPSDAEKAFWKAVRDTGVFYDKVANKPDPSLTAHQKALLSDLADATGTALRAWTDPVPQYSLCPCLFASPDAMNPAWVPEGMDTVSCVATGSPVREYKAPTSSPPTTPLDGASSVEGSLTTALSTCSNNQAPVTTPTGASWSQDGLPAFAAHGQKMVDLVQTAAAMSGYWSTVGAGPE